LMDECWADAERAHRGGHDILPTYPTPTPTGARRG
jgi:hypothetical protein